MTSIETQPGSARRLPPRWFIRFFWVMHRAVYSVTAGRLGLRNAKPDAWGMLRLRTIGRRTGEERVAILGYIEDGADMVTLAMNGWADPEPAWWLNLQAHPEATVDIRGGSVPVIGRAAAGEERDRLWAKWDSLDGSTSAYSSLRSRDTAVVILEPVVEPGGQPR
jgi:deazaflavin-dependent oxidoreductase (nitroreductase family)